VGPGADLGTFARASLGVTAADGLVFDSLAEVFGFEHRAATPTAING
jgi:hypothetical protein